MVTNFEHDVWARKRVGNVARWTRLCATILCVVACAKREAQAPKPEPAAAPGPPSDAQEESVTPSSAEFSWPGALDNADDTEAQAGGSAEKKEAKPAAAAPAPERARTQNAEAAAPAPARPASRKANDEAAVGGAASAGGEPLAEWRHSVALMDQTYDRFQDAMALSTPDCPAADKFRQAVCTLAEHICRLEEQMPTTTKRRCDDGRQRCEQAGQKYRARCD